MNETVFSELCPMCNSDDVISDDPYDVGDKITVSNECMSCGARWDDVYEFSGVEFPDLEHELDNL